MALEKVSGIFYEILIRGVWQPEGDKKLGDFSGAHLIEAEAIVDTETGDVVQFKPGGAVPLSRDKIVGYLGDRFARFEENLRVAQENERAAIAERDAIAAELNSAISAKAQDI